MAITIGRAGTDSGLALDDPMIVRNTGRGLEIAGITRASTAEYAMHLRQQLLGLAELEEPVVPIIFGGPEVQLDGFYRISSVSVDGRDGELGTFDVRWAVSATRVRGSRAPTCFVSVTSAYRLSVYSFFHLACVTFGVPGRYLVDDTYAVGQLGGSRRCEGDGGTGLTINWDPAVAGASQQIGSWRTPIARHYVGGCKIEQLLSDSTYKTIVGRVVDGGTPTGWRLNNGIVRVTPDATNSARLAIEWWNGSNSTWSTPKLFQLESKPVAAFVQVATAVSWEVLRNTPECVSIGVRAFLPVNNAAGYFIGRFTVTIFRGHRRVELGELRNLQGNWRLGCVTAEAAIAITGGIRATSNDASSNRYVLTSDTGNVANDLTQGTIQGNQSLTTYPQIAAISTERGGSGAVTPDVASYEVDSFHTPHSVAANWGFTA